MPYSTASSEERYHGTDSGGRSRARATETYRKSALKTSTQKSSTLVPEAGYQCRKAHSPTLTNRKTKSKTSTVYIYIYVINNIQYIIIIPEILQNLPDAIKMQTGRILFVDNFTKESMVFSKKKNRYIEESLINTYKL